MIIYDIIIKINMLRYDIIIKINMLFKIAEQNLISQANRLRNKNGRLRSKIRI